MCLKTSGNYIVIFVGIKSLADATPIPGSHTDVSRMAYRLSIQHPFKIKRNT